MLLLWVLAASTAVVSASDGTGPSADKVRLTIPLFSDRPLLARVLSVSNDTLTIRAQSMSRPLMALLRTAPGPSPAWTFLSFPPPGGRRALGRVSAAHVPSRSGPSAHRVSSLRSG